jgi:hypothetical protein
MIGNFQRASLKYFPVTTVQIVSWYPFGADSFLGVTEISTGEISFFVVDAGDFVVFDTIVDSF